MNCYFQTRKQYNDDGDQKEEEEEAPDVLDYLLDCFSTRTIAHIRLLLLLVGHLAVHAFILINYILTNLFLIAVCRAKYEGEAGGSMSREEIYVYSSECDVYESLVWSRGPAFALPIYIVLAIIFYCTTPVRLPWCCRGFIWRRRRCEGCRRVERTIALGMIDLINEKQRQVIGVPEKEV